MIPASPRPVRIFFAPRAGGFLPAQAVLIAVPGALVEGLAVEEVAEAVFVAQNAPVYPRHANDGPAPVEPATLVSAIREALARKIANGARLPALSVGDAVYFGHATVRVDSVGFSRIASV